MTWLVINQGMSPILNCNRIFGFSCQRAAWLYQLGRNIRIIFFTNWLKIFQIATYFCESRDSFCDCYRDCKCDCYCDRHCDEADSVELNDKVQIRIWRKFIQISKSGGLRPCYFMTNHLRETSSMDWIRRKKSSARFRHGPICSVATQGKTSPERSREKP